MNELRIAVAKRHLMTLSQLLSITKKNKAGSEEIDIPYTILLNSNSTKIM